MAEKMSVLPPSESGVVRRPIEAATGLTEGLSRLGERRSVPHVDRIARGVVLRALRRLRHGGLIVRDSLGEQRFGTWSAPAESAVLRVDDLRFYRRVLLGGSLAATESYLDGHWNADDLTKVLRIFGRNLTALSEVDRGPVWLVEPLRRFCHWMRRNTRSGSRRNIAAHYDLSNEFFALFLDDTMTYSSGIFENDEATLREASVAKYDRICRKLQLTPRDHLLEIGTGWGGMAIHAARNYGCRVTTTTISKQQFQLASQRIAEAGLDGRITLLADDYRDLSGRYDKLVSIEMVEAVGHQYLPTYFRKCSDLLKPDGMMCLQAITIPDHRYEPYRRSVDFIQRYIFPGGCLPCTATIGGSLRQTDLRLIHWEDFSSDYAKTLACWRANFHAHLDEIRALGYSDTFLRMWEFYLCYCEAGFRERLTGVSQILLAKPLCGCEPLI
jgi:cyclopropane-fatty-acyl-phospholipid synthase